MIARRKWAKRGLQCMRASAIDDDYESGDSFPPDAHPNCVCSWVAIYADDPEAADLADDGEADTTDAEG